MARLLCLRDRRRTTLVLLNLLTRLFAAPLLATVSCRQQELAKRLRLTSYRPQIMSDMQQVPDYTAPFAQAPTTAGTPAAPIVQPTVTSTEAHTTPLEKQEPMSLAGPPAPALDLERNPDATNADFSMREVPAPAYCNKCRETVMTRVNLEASDTSQYARLTLLILCAFADFSSPS